VPNTRNVPQWRRIAARTTIGSAQIGLALPSEALELDESGTESFRQSLRNIINELHPAPRHHSNRRPSNHGCSAALKIVGRNSSVRVKEVLGKYLFRRLWRFGVCIGQKNELKGPALNRRRWRGRN
jgi:hypothetical protein